MDSATVNVGLGRDIFLPVLIANVNYYLVRVRLESGTPGDWLGPSDQSW